MASWLGLARAAMSDVMLMLQAPRRRRRRPGLREAQSIGQKWMRFDLRKADMPS